MECEAPVATAVHETVLVTTTGDDTVVREPIPNWPDVFCPHPYNKPVVVIPSECDAPAAIIDQLVPAVPEANTGPYVVVRELIPNCPEVFCPQPYNKPVVFMPKECDAPADTLVQEIITELFTITGDDTVVMELMPTCPDVFCPQPYSS